MIRMTISARRTAAPLRALLRPFRPALGLLLASALLLAAPAARAQGPAASPYAGQEAREIKAFSAEDLQALRKGEGWGLAKPAELNGMPGPAHLLELQEAIALSPHQVHRLQALYADMNGRARAEGARLISLERELDTAFAHGTVTPEGLRDLLGRIAAVLAELRYAHLAAHLETPGLLSAEQIARYNTLRGYNRPAGAVQEAPMATPPGGAAGHSGHTQHGSAN